MNGKIVDSESISESVVNLNGYAFDHVSIGVRDADAALVKLRKRIGLTPLAGERLPFYRYVLCRVGDAKAGMQLEIIEEQGGEASFMHRFLTRQGEGVHHLTFTVPDVQRTIREVEGAGFKVVQVDLEHPPWREAFIMPTEPGLGVVIQFADTTQEYPPMPQFMSETVEDPETLPHNRGGSDRYWWHDARENVEPGPRAYLRRVELSSDQPQRIVELLSGGLGGQVLSANSEFTEIAWEESILRVLPSEVSGVHALVYAGGPEEKFDLGSAQFVPEDR